MKNNNNHLILKELPSCERPYEKALKFGEKTLSDVELVSVILKTGTKAKNSLELSREILKMPDGSYSILSLCRKSLNELMHLDGIGEVKAITLKCVAEISRRISISGYNSNFQVDNPKVLVEYYMEQLRHLNEERVIAVYLNGSNCFICDKVISTGTINQSIISAREIFLYAIDCSAVYIILIHNHPSGNPKPSSDDIRSTQMLTEGGNILGIKVLDHLIIGDNKYVSFKERGLI